MWLSETVRHIVTSLSANIHDHIGSYEIVRLCYLSAYSGKSFLAKWSIKSFTLATLHFVEHECAYDGEQARAHVMDSFEDDGEERHTSRGKVEEAAEVAASIAYAKSVAANAPYIPMSSAALGSDPQVLEQLEKAPTIVASDEVGTLKVQFGVKNARIATNRSFDGESMTGNVQSNVSKGASARTRQITTSNPLIVVASGTAATTIELVIAPTDAYVSNAISGSMQNMDAMPSRYQLFCLTDRSRYAPQPREEVPSAYAGSTQI
jgi:hypothetical protein